MKIALVQIDPVIGDFRHNLERICHYAQRAKDAGCHLALFPELALCGYPPQDLLERRSFCAAHDEAVQALKEKIHGIAVICGALTRHTGAYGKPLHNSALLVDNGTIQTVHKRLLPAYDVFDESRYFEPGAECRVLQFQGARIGLTICEDVFNEPELLKELHPYRVDEMKCVKALYPCNPVAELVKADASGLDFLINIAASPFHLGKPKAKRHFFGRLCRKYNLPLFYVNQVGGQDSLIFDGGSMVLDSAGAVVAKAKGFQEEMLVVDTENCFASGRTVRDSCVDDEEESEEQEIFAALVLGCRDYLKKCGFQKAVIGLSGGIDSALTAAVAVHALGRENVLGVALPSQYSSEGSVVDARALATNLGIEFKIVPIGDIFQAHLSTLEPHFKGRKVDVTEQNIQARIRGNVLMALANKFGHLLLTTGNKSEMAVGYCTLYGDMSGGLAVIADVPKVMVYRICRFLNRDREVIPWSTVEKPPSAELAPDQKDQDDLPPYETLDTILELSLERGYSAAEIAACGYSQDVVDDILRRIRINEHKRKQAPLVLKVTSKAFGFGRRYPICQNYREGA